MIAPFTRSRLVAAPIAAPAAAPITASRFVFFCVSTRSVVVVVVAAVPDVPALVPVSTSPADVLRVVRLAVRGRVVPLLVRRGDAVRRVGAGSLAAGAGAAAAPSIADTLSTRG